MTNRIFLILQIIVLAVVVPCFIGGAVAWAASPREQLKQMVEQLQKTPNDNALRENIIKLAQELRGNAFSGIYSLQALIDFDTLEAAAVDAGGNLTLFGTRTSKERFVRVAYLDHIATALESSDLRFTLTQTAESARLMDKAMDIPREQVIKALTAWFDENGKMTTVGVWYFGVHGADVKEGMDRYEALAALFKAAGKAGASNTTRAMGEMMRLTTSGGDFGKVWPKLLGALNVENEWDATLTKVQGGKVTQEAGIDEFMPLFLRAFGRVYETDGDAYVKAYQKERVNGRDFTAGLNAGLGLVDQDLLPMLGKLMDQQTAGRADVYVPPHIMKIMLGVEPRVRPEFLGDLPPKSLMARVALEADVLAKNLMEDPDIKKKIPNYRTFVEFDRAKGGGVPLNGHLWITPDGFEIVESADGRSMRFVRTPMKINLEKYVRIDGEKKSVTDPMLAEYAAELTANYDSFAREFPILHELRETMKAVAVARWMHRRGINIPFPKEGRAYWTPPSEIPGIMNMSIPLQNGPVGVVISASGGVDLRAENGWKVSAGNVEIPMEIVSITPSQRVSEQIQRIMRKKIDVPLPEISGNCGQATAGGRALGYVTVLQSKVDSRADAAQAQIQLDRVRRKAETVAYWDRIINANTKTRVAAMADLKRIQREGTEAEKNLFDEAYGTGLALLPESQKVIQAVNKIESTLSAKERSDLVMTLNQVRDLLGAANTAYDGYKEKKFDEIYWSNVSEKLNELSTLVVTEWAKVADMDESLADSIGNRSLLVTGFTYGMARQILRWENLLSLYEVRKQVDNLLGGKATEAEAIRKRYEKAVNEYMGERAKLETILQPRKGLPVSNESRNPGR